MAQFDSVDLQLNLTATDKASDVLRALSGIVDGLVKSIKSIGDIKDPFAQLQADADTFSGTIDGINTSLSTLRDNLKGFSSNPFTKVDESATTLSGDIDGANKSLRTFGDALKSFAPKNPFTGVDGDTTTLTDDIDAARTAWKDLGSAVNSFSVKNNPFSTLDTDLTTLITDLRTAISLMRELDSSSVPSGSSGGGSRTSGGTGVVKGSRTGGSKSSSAPENYGAWFSNLKSSQIPEALMPSYQQATDQWLGWGGATADETAPSRFYQEYNAFMQSQNPSTKTPKPSGGHGFDMMSAGMDAMMGYYGLTSMVSGASNFEYIQELMQLGQGKSKGNYGTADVNNAASVYSLLGLAGMTGSSGVDFMTGVNSNLENMFTQIGKGGLGKEGLILSQAGFGRQDIAGSPWSTIQNIQKGYQTLLNKGEVSQASQFLSITGTSQLAPYFANWGNAKQSVSGINLGMTGAQLGQAVTQDISTQGTLQKLSLEFDTLSQSMTPVVDSFGKMGAAVQPFLAAYSKFTNSPAGKDLTKVGLMFSNPALTGPMLEALWPAVSKEWKSFETSLGKSMGGMWSDITSNWKTFEANFGKSFAALWGDESKDWGKFKSDFGTSLGLLWSDVKSGNWSKFESDFGKSISSLWSDTSSAWDSFKADLSKWISGLWGMLGLDAQAAKIGVEQTVNGIRGVGPLMEPTSALDADKVAYEQQAFTLGVQQKLPSNLPQGKTAHVKVDHSGTLHITFSNPAGISSADQNTIKKIADEVQNSIWGKFKLAYNADISF